MPHFTDVESTKRKILVRVSVILCCYNGEATVGKALDSALAQTMSPSHYEVIVVDDGSTDDTPRIVSSYVERYPNLHYVQSKVNCGLCRACNLGLEMAKGKYVIRLDDDDTFDTSILDSMVAPLDEDRTDLVYSDRYEVMVSTGQVKYIGLDEFNLFRLIAAGVMMRRDLLRELGGYRPLFWEEYDLYLRYALRSGKSFYRIPQALYSVQ